MVIRFMILDGRNPALGSRAFMEVSYIPAARIGKQNEFEQRFWAMD